MKHFIFLTLVLIFSRSTSGQSDTLTATNNPQADKPTVIATDRPEQSASPYVVPLNTLQIETGMVYEYVSEDGLLFDNWSLGTTLLRYGVWKSLELRLGLHYQITHINVPESQTDSVQSGLGPLYTGFKVHVVKENGIRPEIAILAEMTLRHVGNPAFAPTFSYPTAKILVSHTLSDRFSLAYNAGFGFNGENPDGFFIYSATLGYAISTKFAVFAEAYGNFDHGNQPNHRIDGGFKYLLKNNLQLDISGGTGFDKDIDKSFGSLGLAWRIPR